MANFKPGVSIETREAEIVVTVGDANPLALGPHRFQLIVEDDSRNVSEPAVITIIVADTDKPTAVLFSDPPERVAFGKSFKLISRSFDVGGGKIVKHTWKMLEELPTGGGGRPVNPDVANPIDRLPVNPIR